MREPELVLSFRAYLSGLRAAELKKPVTERRRVPTLTELAREVGVSPAQFARIVGGEVQSLNLKTGARIIAVMRQHGFEMEERDLIQYWPAGTEAIADSEPHTCPAP